MPKMKTKKGAAKRFRLSGTGKVRTRTAWGKHLFKSKSASRQMRLKADKVLAERDAKRVRRMLGS